MKEQKNECKRTPPMLINEISRLFHGRMRGFDVDGIMMQDSARLIMRELRHCDGCSQLDLVHKTHLKPPTVSVTLKRMEAEGLVYRVENPSDLRAMQVFLTERGKEHNQRVLQRLHEMDQMLMQGFSAEELAQLEGYLGRMKDNILSEE